MYALFLGLSAASLLIAPCLVAMLPNHAADCDCESDSEPLFL